MAFRNNPEVSEADVHVHNRLRETPELILMHEIESLILLMNTLARRRINEQQ